MYKVVENKVSYQNRKGVLQEITPNYKYSIHEEGAGYILHMSDSFGNQKEKAELIVRLLNEELNGLVGMASVHGWKSSLVEQGIRLREEMALLHGA